MDSRTIGLAVGSAAPGGAERILLLLAEGLRDLGHQVVPIVPDHPGSWLAGELRSRDFEPEGVSPRGSFDLGALKRLARALRVRDVDLLHSHEFTMAVYGAAAARVVRVPHVLTFHSALYCADRLRRRVATRWSIRGSLAAAAVSDHTRQALETSLGLQVGSLETVHNGIRVEPPTEDVRAEFGISPEAVLILAVGNLYPVKGHPVLIEAVGELRRRRPEVDCHLAIAGKVSMAGDVRHEARHYLDQAEREGIADRLHLLGFRQDVPDLLLAADVFAMPSLSEGLPLALLEAMFAGRAIVASAVGGIPEAVEHEREALLVEPGSSSSLASALEALATDRPRRERLGRAAATRARREFSLDAMVARYLDLYDR